MFCKKGFFRNFAKIIVKHLWQSLSLLKKTLAQVFPCKFYEIYEANEQLPYDIFYLQNCKVITFEKITNNTK